MPLKQVHRLMLHRCYNPNHASYPRYGARGIRVCERWLLFSEFKKDLKVQPQGYTLDRLDNDKGYSPENCRWATWPMQCRNQRRHRTTIAVERTKGIFIVKDTKSYKILSINTDEVLQVFYHLPILRAWCRKYAIELPKRVWP